MGLNDGWKYILTISVVIALVCPDSARCEDRERLERAKAEFLCQWRTQNTVPGNSWPLDICANPQLPLGTMLVQINNWWGFWFEHNKLEVAEALREKCGTDWLASTQYQQLEQQVALERQQARDAALEQEKAEKARLEAIATDQQAAELKNRQRQREVLAQRRKQELLQAEREANARQRGSTLR